MHWVCSTIGCWPNPPFHGVCTQLGSSDRGTKMNKGPCQGRKESKHTWLVVWNMNFIFPYIGNNHPNWLSYFSEGLAQPPTRYIAIFFLYKSDMHQNHLRGLICGAADGQGRCWAACSCSSPHTKVRKGAVLFDLNEMRWWCNVI